MKNSKGLLFSIDAALGIAIVFIAIAAMSTLYLNSPREAKTFQAVEQSAGDRATVGFYLNQTANESISLSAKFGYCAHYYKYDPGNDAGPSGVQASLLEKTFCDEK